jgi:hypothetical protein
VTLTAAVIFLYGEGIFNVELSQYLANLTMIHGYFGVKHVDGVYWSLLVELKFYFLIFILIIFKQIHHIKIYLYPWLAISFIHHFFPLSGAAAFFLIPEWAAYFIAGAAFYLIRLEGHSLDKYALIFISYILACLNAVKGVPSANAHFNTEFSPAIIVLLISSFYFLFFLISAKKTHWINKPYFTVIGALTYPLYLVHQNIGFIIFNHFDSDNYKYLVLFFTIALSLTISLVINIYIEKKYSGKLKNILNKAVYSVPFLIKKNRFNEK